MAAYKRAMGFTLLELITVILVLGILTFFALPKLRISDSGLLASRDLIVTAASHAQQAAMARASNTNPITLTLSAQSIDVRENGSSVTWPGVNYPVNLPNGISVTAGQGTLSFNKLGETTATTISLNNGGASIQVEASGYAH